MSKQLVSLLPLPPIWKHKIRSLSCENTHKNPPQAALNACESQWVFACVCTGCTYCVAETAWLKTNWQKTFEAEKKGEKKRARTTTCQERNASNFSVICQPFNKTRALCPHTPPLSHKRQRWRGRGGKTQGWGKKTESLICLFPVCNHSTHLTFLLFQVVIFPSYSLLPPLTYLRQRKTKVYICACQGRQGNKHLATGPVSLRRTSCSLPLALSKGEQCL